MIILGLTGSIGMGKSTTAEMFRAHGTPVFDSDAAVHALYRGGAAAAVEDAWPGTTRDGIVDRTRLGARVLGDPQALKRLEAIVHPLVRAARDRFLAECRAAGDPIVLLDVPLLFETGGDAEVDAVVVASAPESVQKARVMQRSGMTPERFSAILKQQLPDADKRQRARFVVETGQGLDVARAQVGRILAELRGGQSES